MRSMAGLLGNAPSTVSREINRNGGYDRYRAAVAEENAWRRGHRPNSYDAGPFRADLAVLLMTCHRGFVIRKMIRHRGFSARLGTTTNAAGVARRCSQNLRTLLTHSRTNEISANRSSPRGGAEVS